MIGQRFFVMGQSRRHGRVPTAVVTVLHVAFVDRWRLLVENVDGEIVPMVMESFGLLVRVTDSKADQARVRRLTRTR